MHWKDYFCFCKIMDLIPQSITRSSMHCLKLKKCKVQMVSLLKRCLAWTQRQNLAFSDWWTCHWELHRCHQRWSRHSWRESVAKWLMVMQAPPTIYSFAWVYWPIWLKDTPAPIGCSPETKTPYLWESLWLKTLSNVRSQTLCKREL